MSLYKKPQIIGKKHWMDSALFDKNGRITYIEDFFVCQTYHYNIEGKVCITSYFKDTGEMIKRAFYKLNEDGTRGEELKDE